MIWYTPDLKYGAYIKEAHPSYPRRRILIFANLYGEKQAVYAKITIYNMASRIRSNLEKKRARKKKAKHKHKIHFTNCIKIVKKFRFVSSDLDFRRIDNLTLKLTVPIREGRVDTHKRNVLNIDL